MKKMYQYTQTLGRKENQKDIPKLVARLSKQLENDSQKGSYDYRNIIISKPDDFEKQSTFVVYYESESNLDSDGEVQLAEWVGYGDTEASAYLDYLDKISSWIKQANPEISLGDMIVQTSYESDRCVVYGYLYY